MKITINNAQQDGGGLCPHIVRIWQNGSLFAEYVAKAEATGFTNKEYTIADNTYDIEIVNPNITDSNIQSVLFFFDATAGYSQVELPNARQSIKSGQSYLWTGISSNNYPNLTIETNNVGTSSTLKYSVQGISPITTGNDLDGNAIPAGKAYYKQISFISVADGTASPLTLNNKKNWQTSDGLVDVSGYIPYIPYFDSSTPLPATLTKPTVSKTAAVNTESITFGGMQANDVMSLLANDTTDVPFGYASQAIVPASGNIVVNLSSLGGITLKGRYTRNGVASPYSDNVVITQDNTNKLNDLTYTRTVLSNTGNYYVNEQLDVTGFFAGATLLIKKSDGVVATANTDYRTVAITDGYRITFLSADFYTIAQSKNGYINSTTLMLVVEQTRPTLAVPVPSATNIVIGGIVTISNQTVAGYTNINVYKEGVLVIPSGGDYSLNVGVYSFLTVGSFTFVGQKTGVNDSAASVVVVVVGSATDPLIADWEDVITQEAVDNTTDPLIADWEDVITQVSTTTPVGTLDTRIYTIIVRNYCSVNTANVQVGTGNTLAEVINWTDGLVIQLDIVDNIIPKFFIRDKTKTSVVSPAYTMP